MFTAQKLLALAMTPILVLSLSGCRKAEPTHTMPDGMVMQDKDMGTAKDEHGAMKMEHSSGKMAAGKSVALPVHFPSDVPIYPGARIAIGSSNAEGATVGLETDDIRQKVVSYYEKKLAAQGWKIDKTTSSKTNSIVQGKRGNRSCAIVITDRSKFAKTSISLMTMGEKS
ncbi:MAG: hypothetical protein ABI210_06660 [Abditibacteriaceae bacterium]